METLNQYETPAALILFGIVVGYFGLLLLGEYRKLFIENPKAVMSTEVLFRILHIGAPGYLAAVLLICSASFLVLGIVTLVAPFIFELKDALADIFENYG